jgi:hypothetical protein
MRQLPAFIVIYISCVKKSCSFWSLTLVKYAPISSQQYVCVINNESKTGIVFVDVYIFEWLLCLFYT